MKDRLQKLGLFWVSLPICAFIGILGIALPNSFAETTNALIRQILQVGDWYFIISMSVFVVFCVVIAASRYGSVRLGKPGEKSEFGFLAWFAMLFAAGMGSATLLYGVAEPTIHFSVPPEGAGGTP
ncbi:MAG: BCCT family transporter, partial [Myxococcota bacterium]